MKLGQDGDFPRGRALRRVREQVAGGKHQFPPRGSTPLMHPAACRMAIAAFRCASTPVHLCGRQMVEEEYYRGHRLPCVPVRV